LANIVRFCKGLRALAVALVLLTAAAAPAAAQDPSFLSFSAGWFDMNRQKDEAIEVGVQWRGSEKLWIFQPMAGAMATFDGAGYVYAGISLDIFLGNRLVFRPSFAPGLYAHGSGYDLGHVVEFRSAAELAWRFDDRSRLGIEFYHLSNAHLGDKNPGEESLTLTYAIPIDKLFGK
jgi:lipid A 3-O-deacylase